MIAARPKDNNFLLNFTFYSSLIFYNKYYIFLWRILKYKIIKLCEIVYILFKKYIKVLIWKKKKEKEYKNKIVINVVKVLYKGINI